MMSETTKMPETAIGLDVALRAIVDEGAATVPLEKGLSQLVALEDQDIATELAEFAEKLLARPKTIDHTFSRRNMKDFLPVLRRHIKRRAKLQARLAVINPVEYQAPTIAERAKELLEGLTATPRAQEVRIS
jgi:primosomal protein N''